MAALPFVPRLLPLAIIAMLALVGVKSVGLVRYALAQGSAAAPATPPDPAPVGAAPSRGMPAATPRPTPAPAANVTQPQVIVPPPPAAAAEPPISSAERALLLDLRKRRTELEAREASLVAREGILAVTEKRLAARVDELSALQRRLEALEEARRKHGEENWRGLVKLYETMKPRDAAAIFNELDKSVLLSVLDRMKESKAAPVLAAMLPERARHVTAELARTRAQANRPADLSTTPPATPPRPPDG